jgi:hypothetical protein
VDPLTSVSPPQVEVVLVPPQVEGVAERVGVSTDSPQLDTGAGSDESVPQATADSGALSEDGGPSAHAFEFGEGAGTVAEWVWPLVGAAPLIPPRLRGAAPPRVDPPRPPREAPRPPRKSPREEEKDSLEVWVGACPFLSFFRVTAPHCSARPVRR